jgi:hypothetical protein
MKLASFNLRTAPLLQALETLAQRPDNRQAAETLCHELTGITVLVARKFTNDRTADGLLNAYYLTIGCVSLGISQADIAHDAESELSFLLQLGAERVFQAGFRHIKELAELPGQAILTDFDRDPLVQQRNIKTLFLELCKIDPNTDWHGDEIYKKEWHNRRENKILTDCAKWLRLQHHTGAIKDDDLDANAVISIAVIFAITDDGRIVARTSQKGIENLIRSARKTKPEIEVVWRNFLEKIPSEFRPVLQARMDEYSNTLIKNIMSRTAIKKIVIEIQNYHAGIEQDVEYE